VCRHGPFTLMLVHRSRHVPMLFDRDVVVPYTKISFEQLFVVHYFSEVLWPMIINIPLVLMANHVPLGDVTNVINRGSVLRCKRPRAGSIQTPLVEGRNIVVGDHSITVF
jgi:hypothetical protein